MPLHVWDKQWRFHKFWKGEGGNVSVPLYFVTGEHNGLYAIYTGRGDLLKKLWANRGKRLPPFRIRHWWQLTETAVFQCRLKSSFLNLAFVIFTLISVDTEHFVYPCCYYACRRRSRKKTSAICLRISRWNSWRWKSTSWNPVTRRNSLQGRSLIWEKIIFIIVIIIIIL